MRKCNTIDFYVQVFWYLITYIGSAENTQQTVIQHTKLNYFSRKCKDY
jgi:hypothetical protein